VESSDPGTLRCAACGLAITRRDERLEILGLHEHVADNPHGHRYRVRCFASATNLETTTNPSSEWSWFPGYRWSVQVCRGCEAHLGWRFDREGDGFYGLISDSLRDV
jgi:hypothetical protein